jgi:hypothetical protein
MIFTTSTLDRPAEKARPGRRICIVGAECARSTLLVRARPRSNGGFKSAFEHRCAKHPSGRLGNGSRPPFLGPRCSVVYRCLRNAEIVQVRPMSNSRIHSVGAFRMSLSNKQIGFGNTNSGGRKSLIGRPPIVSNDQLSTVFTNFGRDISTSFDRVRTHGDMRLVLTLITGPH